ncbi:MAG: glucosaminidase domain-containing protein [Gammaproteobacteria bacterium]|nr:glucosaminidase domain-containing protein [Gammaproteobacteria bacterium]
MKWFPITFFLLLALPASAVLYVNQSPIFTAEVPAEESPIDGQQNVEQTTQTDVVSQSQIERVPDFSACHDVRQKKRVFFEFMLPLIREANANIRKERTKLITLSNKLEAGLVLQRGEHQYLSQLFKRYRMKAPLKVETQLMNQLLERVDIVPASLVLAQSANESGWGTSRFAVEANNYFGIWCFSSGCGLKPRSRDDGKTHEVASYDSVQQGITAYMHNINTHKAYRDLRIIRSEQRHLQNHFMGLQLTDGLHQYSERGEDYVREIKQMIRINNLHEYTLASTS